MFYFILVSDYFRSELILFSDESNFKELSFWPHENYDTMRRFPYSIMFNRIVDMIQRSVRKAGSLQPYIRSLGSYPKGYGEYSGFRLRTP